MYGKKIKCPRPSASAEYIKPSDPLELGNISLNSLPWADDLVIISRSEQGLQRSNDALSNYCYKWNIAINPDKAVCMVMSKGRTRKHTKFQLNGVDLKLSKSVTYLGFLITNNMNMKYMYMIDDRMLKANRAAYLLRQAKSTESGNIINIKLAMNLFYNLCWCMVPVYWGYSLQLIYYISHYEETL